MADLRLAAIETLAEHDLVQEERRKAKRNRKKRVLHKSLPTHFWVCCQSAENAKKCEHKKSVSGVKVSADFAQKLQQKKERCLSEVSRDFQGPKKETVDIWLGCG